MEGTCRFMQEKIKKLSVLNIAIIAAVAYYTYATENVLSPKSVDYAVIRERCSERQCDDAFSLTYTSPDSVTVSLPTGQQERYILRFENSHYIAKKK